MDSIFVWTVGDVLKLAFLGLGLVGIVLAFIWASIEHYIKNRKKGK